MVLDMWQHRRVARLSGVAGVGCCGRQLGFCWYQGSGLKPDRVLLLCEQLVDLVALWPRGCVWIASDAPGALMLLGYMQDRVLLQQTAQRRRRWVCSHVLGFTWR